ncbi:MAG: hypothetical protein AAGD07_25925 [Planctomycetota bacterium]
MTRVWIGIASIGSAFALAQTIDSTDSEERLDLGGELEVDSFQGFEMVLSTDSVQRHHCPTLLDRITHDHRQFYSQESLGLLGGGLLVGAAIANTNTDQWIHDRFQRNVRGATSDDWSEILHANKELGNGIYTLPVMAGAWAASSYFDNSPVAVNAGDWGERSIRSFLVGAPPMLLAQQLTGASRPREASHGSTWRPFADVNGVSGHSFMSALPFINAAKMTENFWAKSAFYAGSFVGPLSRINDEAHYPSQAALGWWFAYLSATAIETTEVTNPRWRVIPFASANHSGLLFEFNY